MKRVPSNRDHLRSVFHWMIERCYNESFKQYKDYGGRGISICDEWRGNFNAFYEWSISNGYAVGLTIDRINNDGNYEPSNCRWATRIVNANNTRRTKKYVIRGVCGTLSELCRVFDKNYYRVRRRVALGWSVEDALFEPKMPRKIRKTNRLVTVDGITAHLKEMADRYGINKTTVRNRLDRGWDMDAAFKIPPLKTWNPHIINDGKGERNVETI